MKKRNSALSLIPAPEVQVDLLQPEPVGELALSTDRAVALAANTPTPFLVVSEARLRDRVETLRTHLPGVELYYAMKSNPDPEILRVLKDIVDGIDVASYGEIMVADAVGVAPSKLFHSHPIKKESDIAACVKHGVQWFVYDNIDELPKLKANAPDANLMLRVAIKNPTCVVNLGAKFGAQESDAVGLLQAARDMGLTVRGIAFHVGSQTKDPDVYVSALKTVRGLFDEAAAAGILLDTLDIGGGFPVTYRTVMAGLDEFCQVVSQALKEYFPTGVRVLAEPGRCISGDSVTLVTRVVGRSFRSGVPWYYLDDGVYGAFSGKLFDHADYQLIPVRRGPLTKCVVAGPTCDSIDIVSIDQMLPELEVGDLIVVPAMGAYTKASATCFNGFAPPVTLSDKEAPARSSRKRTKVSRITTRRRIAAGAVDGPRSVS